MSDITHSPDESFKEKLKSLSFMGPRSSVPPKKTVDVHDTHKVQITEHWGDRQDITVKPDPVKLKLAVTNGDN